MLVVRSSVIVPGGAVQQRLVAQGLGGLGVLGVGDGAGEKGVRRRRSAEAEQAHAPSFEGP
jgi:hypothetical protein